MIAVDQNQLEVGPDPAFLTDPDYRNDYMKGVRRSKKKGSKKKGSKHAKASQRGASHERKAVLLLEAQGYKVERAPKVVKWINGRPLSTRHDFFGVIDIIAVKRGEPIRFIQVGVKGMRRKKERDVEPFAWDYTDGDSARCEVWGFVEGSRSKGGQLFKVTTWNGVEWADCTDEVCLVKEK